MTYKVTIKLVGGGKKVLTMNTDSNLTLADLSIKITEAGMLLDVISKARSLIETENWTSIEVEKE